MGRPPRIHFPGAIFHLISRGNDKQDIYLDDEDRRRFLSILTMMKKRHPFLLYAYCLMTNHFHLLVEVDRCEAKVFMHAILTSYSHYFNSRHNRVGHLFQCRYTSLLCQRDSYLIRLIQYIHLNPVAAGMVSHAFGWPWSGHHDYLSERPGLTDTSFPLSLFGADRKESLDAYKELVSQPRCEPPSTQRIQPFTPEMFEPLGMGKSLHMVALETAQATGISEGFLRSNSRARCLTPVRRRFLEQALREGYSAAEAGAFLNRSPVAISRLLANYR